MRLLMMCAGRAELDKAESLLLLLLLGSSPLKSQRGPRLVFKTSNSVQLHVCVHNSCAFLDLTMHACIFCFVLNKAITLTQLKNSPPVSFMWKQSKSHNPHICDTAWLKMGAGSKMEGKKSTAICKAQNTEHDGAYCSAETDDRFSCKHLRTVKSRCEHKPFWALIIVSALPILLALKVH